MDIEQMDLAAKEINDLILAILMPARTEKKINKEAFRQLNEILRKLKKEIKNSSSISRKLTGVLFFLYVSLSSEAQYCEVTDALFLEVASLEDTLDTIFGSDNLKGFNL